MKDFGLYAKPNCLSNCQIIDLGTIYCNNRQIPNIPQLTTIYEFGFPLLVAKNSINGILSDINNVKSINILKGLFVLGYSQMEVFLSDLLKRVFYLHPSLNSIYDDKINIYNANFAISLNTLISGNVLSEMLAKNIDKWNIETLIKKLIKTLNYDFKINMQKLNEIRCTRNILVHNNLIADDNYLLQTKSMSRAKKKGDTVKFDLEYVKDSIYLFEQIINSIHQAISITYAEFTLIELFKRLWYYTFDNQMIRFEDYWKINLDQDSIDGPLISPPTFLSTSEVLLFEFWQSQRFGTPITNFGFSRLDPENNQKLSLLVQIFGHLRLTRW